MKSAELWITELAARPTGLCRDCIVTVADVRAIQADAVQHCLEALTNAIPVELPTVAGGITEGMTRIVHEPIGPKCICTSGIAFDPACPYHFPQTVAGGDLSKYTDTLPGT